MNILKKMKNSGQAPFSFIHRPDLSILPQAVQENEVELHGGFASDDRSDYGHIYYGMPGCGLMRIDPDLKRQELIGLPSHLNPLNFHSTKIGEIDGQRRLFLPANDNEMVAILTLEGDVEYLLPRPEFEAYQDPKVPFKPTDVALIGEHLFVADGYGSNYIASVNPVTHNWLSIFGGETKDPDVNGKFGTAHGINSVPFSDLLAVADRWNGRIQLHNQNGVFSSSHKLPQGTWPCGIQYLEFQGRWLALVGCLYDDVSDTSKPGVIYILDAQTYEILSKIRPNEELGIKAALRIHNVIGHYNDDNFYLVCQSWNPGHYFVLQKM